MKKLEKSPQNGTKAISCTSTNVTLLRFEDDIDFQC